MTTATFKICHIFTTFYERGAPRFLEILRGLRSERYQIDLWVGEEFSPDWLEKIQAEDVRVYRVPHLQKYIAPCKDVKAFWSMARTLMAQRYDLVHTHLAKAGILGRLAACWAGIPLIVHTVHGPSFPESKPWWQRAIFKQLERWVGRRTDALVFVGQDLRSRYLDAGVGQEDNSYLIYTGKHWGPFLRAASMDPKERQQRRSRLGFKDDDLVLGYVARVVPSKGHLYALRAVKRMIRKFPQLRLLLVGDAMLPGEQQYKQRLMKEVEKLQLQDVVQFLGHQHDIENYYAIFDIFIFPSLYEGLPNVILEAAVMELPIVSFDIDGVREILGQQACVVPRGNLGAFTQSLEEVLLKIKNGAYQKPSYPSIQRLLSRWSIEAMVEGKQRLYERLIGKGTLSSRLESE